MQLQDFIRKSDLSLNVTFFLEEEGMIWSVDQLNQPVRFT